MKKTIKFLIGDPSYYRYYDEPYLYINPTQHMLKTYHDHFGKSKDDYIWLNCKHDIFSNLDGYIEEICQEDIDILCLSMYVWNVTFYHDFIRKYKKLRPNTTIIVGGPEVNARTDLDWFEKNPEVSYVLYGDGEKTFSMLLDRIAGHDIKLSDIPNLIYLDEKNKRIVTRLEILRDKNYWALSPLIHCKDYLKREIDEVLKVYPRIIPCFNWERTRGCPYSCSYCDWSSGLHNKVSRRTCDFKDELNMMVSINNGRVALGVIDANFGMYDEDFEIIKYINENLIEKHPTFRMLFPSWAKENKKKVFEIWDYIMDKGKDALTLGKNLKISVQDTHEEILNNVDRPSVKWSDVKDYYVSRKDKYSPMVELIAGLPGQTRKTWNETLIDTSEVFPEYITAHYWSMLPYAPSSKPEYQEKYKLKVTPTIILYHSISSIVNVSREEYVSSLQKSSMTNYEEVGGVPVSVMKMVTGTYSYDLEDLIYFHLSAAYMNDLIFKANVMKVKHYKLIKEKFNRAIPGLEKMANAHYIEMKDDYDKHGVLFFCAKHPDGFYCDYVNWFKKYVHDRPIVDNAQINNRDMSFINQLNNDLKNTCSINGTADRL